MNKISRKITFLLTASTLALCFAGCSKDDPASVTSSQQNIVLEQADSRAEFEIRANTSWTAECFGLDESGNVVPQQWFVLTPSSGRGTQRVALDVLSSNNSSKARNGRIVVTYGRHSYQIDIKQRGLTETGCSVTPLQIGLGAKACTGNTFTVNVENREAVITAKCRTAGADWVKNISKKQDLSYGYSRREVWAFDLDEHQLSDTRTAEIEVTVTFNHNTYTHVVTVTQSGLGAPAVKTTPNVYMNCGQTTHRQSIWIEEGDQTNVNYNVTWTSNYQGTGNENGWITNATIENNELVITSEPNTDEASREGSVLVVASRGNTSGGKDCSTISVKVVQAGHKAAGAVIPVAEIVHNYLATEYRMPITLLNGSRIVSINTNDPGMFGNISPVILPLMGDNILVYNLAEYDGSMGDYREGIITLRVTNGNSNDAVVSVKVRQYAPEMPAISMPVNTITSDYRQKENTFPINALNASEVNLVSSSEGWLRIDAEGLINGTMSYEVDEYDGSNGDFREAVITIEAANDHANKAYYYITFRQYAPKMLQMNLPEYIGVGFEEQDFVLPVSLQGGELSVVSAPDWAPANYAADSLTIAFTENSGLAATNYMRQGVVTLEYKKGETSAYYYIHVHQYARDMAYVSPTEVNMTISSVSSGFGRYGWRTVTVLNLPGNAGVSIASSETTGNLYDLTKYHKVVPQTHNVPTGGFGLKFVFTVNDADKSIVVDHYSAPFSTNPETVVEGHTLGTIYKFSGPNDLKNSATVNITVDAFPYLQHITVMCTAVCSSYDIFIE